SPRRAREQDSGGRPDAQAPLSLLERPPLQPVLAGGEQLRTLRVEPGVLQPGPRERGDFRPQIQVPNSSRIAAGDQPPALATDGHGFQGVGAYGASAQREVFPAGNDFPQADHAAPHTRQPAPVPTDLAGGPHKPQEFAARPRVPEPGRPVPGAADQEVPA